MFAHPEGMFHKPGVGSSNPPTLRFRVGMAPSVRVVSVMQINTSCGPGRFVALSRMPMMRLPPSA